MAFVDAAENAISAAGRKATIAQIAASTGLSRTEVSTILRKEERSLIGQDPRNRAVNVAAGWLTDKKFCTSKGAPRPLQFREGSQDFSSLVKKYSGDIPARAMLREMQRLDMVVRDSSGTVFLIRPQAPVKAANARAIKAIEPWIALVRDAVGGFDKQNLTSSTSQVALHFDSIPQVLAVLRDLNARRAAFVQSIAELGVRPANDNKYSMRINIAVAVARPIRTRSNHNRRP